MLHGHLTPLGRQLRSVLASFSQSSRVHVCNTPRPRPRARHVGASHNGIRDYSRFTGKSDGQISTTEDAKQDNAVLDGQLQGKRLMDKTSRKISLQSILARYNREENGERDPLQAEWEAPYTPTEAEMEHLTESGYSREHVRAWSDIVLATNSDEAATFLARRIKSDKDDPMFLLALSLQREYVSARALRTGITTLSSWVEEMEERGGESCKRNENGSLVVVIIRLIRHAREVWPQSLPTIVSLFLRVLKHQDATLPPAGSLHLHYQATTFALNKIMSLVSLSTAIMPFKDNVFQETAIIPLLRYMDAHNPPLQITRAGYRAVVRIQLAQRKTEHEQQWAELKALSWPPWKVDRTAMDASVTLDYGITRARATLISMRNAGYRPLAWEKAAEVYTGWDPDGTPTVQRRVMMGSPGHTPRNKTAQSHASLRDVSPDPPYLSEPIESIPWAARIDSTRTIQEAWACYLAWEDAKLPPDQNVYLNIMQKLHAQAKEASKQIIETPAWDLLPGDTPQISPLPPSTHLYTYTRTPAPPLDDFYTMLFNQGVRFTGHCLAFLLRSASLQTGLHRIKDHREVYPDLQGVLAWDANYDVERIPKEIFTACVTLFARSGGYFLDSREYRWRRRDVPDQYHQNEDAPSLDGNLVILRAMDLLRLRPHCGRQTWVAVFEGLTRDSHLPGFGQALETSGRGHRQDAKRMEDARMMCVGGMVAYELLGKLVEGYRREFGDLDPVGSFRLCVGMEGMVRGVWKVAGVEDAKSKGIVERCRVLLESGEAARVLRTEFERLVGSELYHDGEEEEEELSGDEAARIPRLLYTPNPAFLHAYIRALGFAGDFHGLASVVGWMKENKEELFERAGRDRAGRDMQRKVLVALRVFLERSWRHVERRGNSGSSNSRVLGIDERLGRSASEGLVKGVREIVDGVEEWEGWAEDEEVARYCEDGRFEGLRGE